MATTSIFSRKKDLVYLVFFLIHLPVMLAFDLTGYYPTAIKPAWMDAVKTWYYHTYGDRFFVAPPPWFPLYTLLEAFYHLPLTLWAIPALLRNDPRLPLQLLVFGLQTTFTTMTCLAEMYSWEDTDGGSGVKWVKVDKGVGGLGGMYGGYLCLGVFMAVDCYARLDQMVARTKGLQPITKKEL
ncbi:transmembrane protein 6/97 [Clohesyomyces aquaticus]|uniref:Efficient mitochondria targeting-associated protein 19 n=1 Tax=Clohesyomyces aquaticus TaxID=1231657 RepID=A0A1Y1Y9F7_9PLEO|nr:transmembrane protein 6/97 [Clohesyomyces aquaticus]